MAQSVNFHPCNLQTRRGLELPAWNASCDKGIYLDCKRLKNPHQFLWGNGCFPTEICKHMNSLRVKVNFTEHKHCVLDDTLVPRWSKISDSDTHMCTGTQQLSKWMANDEDGISYCGTGRLRISQGLHVAADENWRHQ